MTYLLTFWAGVLVGVVLHGLLLGDACEGCRYRRPRWRSRRRVRLPRWAFKASRNLRPPLLRRSQ